MAPSAEAKMYERPSAPARFSSREDATVWPAR